MKAMNTIQAHEYAYVRINKNYIATVRSLDDLRSYLANVGDTDETFGEITSMSMTSVSKSFMNELHSILNQHKASINQHLIGKRLTILRNQGVRNAVIVAVSEKGLLIEYLMPNGTSALNVIETIDTGNQYKAITYAKALATFKVDPSQLVNNPQGKRKALKTAGLTMIPDGTRFARKCDVCGCGMNQGFVLYNGEEYYCDNKCLSIRYTDQQWAEIHGNDNGYWTEWDERDADYVMSDGRLVEYVQE